MKYNKKYMGMCRPDFEEVLESGFDSNRHLRIICRCLDVLYHSKDVHIHWLQGHFDKILERDLTHEELGK